jgi:hypothetical protein
MSIIVTTGPSVVDVVVAPVVVVVTPVVVDDAPVTAGAAVVVVSAVVVVVAPVPEQAVTRQAARRKRMGRLDMVKEGNKRSRFVTTLTAHNPLPTGAGSPQADRFECNLWEGGPMPKYLVQAAISLEGYTEPSRMVVPPARRQSQQRLRVWVERSTRITTPSETRL